MSAADDASAQGSHAAPAVRSIRHLPVEVRVAERVAVHDGLHVMARVDAPDLLARPAYIVLDMASGRLSLANEQGQHAYVDLADLILKLARQAGTHNPAESRFN